MAFRTRITELFGIRHPILLGGMRANRHVPGWIETALEAGVRRFESVGDSPEPFIDRIHRGGGLLMHKCPSVRHAQTAARLGVDAIALVGCEERIVDADQYRSTAILGSLNDIWRVLHNEAAREVQKIESADARSHGEFGDLTLSSRTRQRVYEVGAWTAASCRWARPAASPTRLRRRRRSIDKLVRDAARAAVVVAQVVRDPDIAR